jgi:hypothetical protein
VTFASGSRTSPQRQPAYRRLHERQDRLFKARVPGERAVLAAPKGLSAEAASRR